MSFGVSPAADINIVATFCKTLYRKCSDASGEYDEISREVKNLFTVLRHLTYEVNAPESPLNRDQSLWDRQLAPVVADCQSTLQQLDDLLQKYGRLDSDSNNPSSARKVMRDKIRVGSNEMDQLGTIRVKLISHKTNLTLFLDTIQLSESGKVASVLDENSEQLDMILDKVDLIASRMTQKFGGSMMSTYSDDEKEVWKDFRRELVREGFSSSVLQQHEEVLRAYIREIDQNGLLDEVSPPSANTGINPQQWLKSVVPFSPGSAGTLDSTKSSRDDESAKQMMIQDDNSKFPTTMKLERPKPESFDLRPAQIPRREPMTRNLNDHQQRAPIPILKVPNNKIARYADDSEEDSETENPSKNPSQGSLIRTSDLIEMTQASHVNSMLLPSSFDSQLSLNSNNLRRFIEYPLQDNARNNSSQPLRNESLVRRGSNTSTGNERPVFRLAPDSQGKQIPSDASWTKISRRLVSLEVLEQDRRRYEARPEFVAVLGILSREEIQSYAIRSQALRASRSRHSNFKYPPPIKNSQRSMRERLSSDEADTSDSDVPRNQQQRRNEPRKYTSSVAGSDTTPRSGYPNPYGLHAPPSPLISPVVSRSQHLRITRSPHRNTDPRESSASSSPAREERGSHYHHSRKGEGRDRHHSSSRSGRSKRDHKPHSSTRSSDTNSQRNKEAARRRWRANLAVAGIGGAAVSLLGVLAEAAEGL